MCLEKKLQRWQSAGLLTAEQREQISAYEKNRISPFYGLSLLGVFCIGLGLISLIAFYWDVIPGLLKFFVSILLLSGAGVYSWLRYMRQDYKRADIGIFAFALLILANIGLLGQIFQLQSETALPFALWSVLVLPLLFFSRSRVLALVWFPAANWSLLDLALSVPQIHDFWRVWAEMWFFGPIMFLTFLWYVISQWGEAYLKPLAYSLFAAVRDWAALGLVFLVLLVDSGHGQGDLSEDVFPLLFMINLLLLIAFNLLSWFMGRRLGSYLAPYAMTLILFFSFVELSDLPVLLALLGLGYISYKKNDRRRFNLALFLLGLKLFWVYAELVNGLFGFGITLLTSGFVLLGLVKLALVLKGKFNEK